MNRQQELFEQRIMVGASVQLIGNALQNNLNGMTWTDVEAARKEIAKVKSAVSNYLSSVEDCIVQGADTWTKQWELAEELYEPFKEDYNPHDIDKEALKAEFVEKGLEPEFADQLVISIADVDYDRYGDGQ